MNNYAQYAQELIDFIYESPTAFHAVENVKKVLLENGFSELKEEDKWNLQRGGKYFTTKNSSAVFAFTIGLGEVEEEGFKIIGAHTDSPTFRIKPNPEMKAEGYVKLNTEVYGGPILNTWMDRPLSVAGRVTIKSDDFMPRIEFINIKKPIMIIPNLAIHLNRNINSGVELNRQKDMLPIISLINAEMENENMILKLIAKELSVKEEDILDFDLFLYEFEKGCIMGVNDEFISASRLDNLAMVHAGLNAILEIQQSKKTNILACYDNEEVGSTTKQGADSEVLAHILERIAIALGKSREDLFRAYARSFMISADLAHAVHPNSSEKYDPVNKTKINGGPVIKISASQSYTSDSVSSAVYQMICSKAGVPVQKFVNRSDERGGSTIGPISSSHLPINSVDIGTPILAMHSVRELGGVKDHTYVTKSFIEFYGGTLKNS